MDTTNPPSNESTIPSQPKSSKWLRFFLQLLLGIVACLATLIILVRIFYPLPQMINAYVSSSYTSTPLPPTNTRPPTQTKTSTPTSTSTPTPTITPLPSSNYSVDIQSISPDPPAYGIAAIILNDDVSVTVEPPFTDIQWTSSSTIAEQIGREILEPYHATFGPGSATWMMDVPLTPGYYEIFVLDTLYSSGGSLNFNVSLGNKQLNPVTGVSTLVYKSSRGNPAQFQDLWRSIGIFYINNEDILSVHTSWEARDEQTIVAIDRVLIMQLSYAENQILSQLPEKSPIFLVDDQEAVYDPQQYWEIRENVISWGRKFHLIKNPPIDAKVTWVYPEPITTAEYELWAWIPEIHGNLETSYRVYADGNEISPENSSGGPMVITPGTNTNGTWLKIGNVKIPERFGEQVTLTITLDIKGNSIGDAAADVLALIRLSE